MKNTEQKSKCKLCNTEVSPKGIVRHFQSCLKKNLLPGKEKTNQKLFYISAVSSGNPNYFLHLLVRGDATLKHIDKFLRQIWLECCGHMSAFSNDSSGDEISMSKRVDAVFKKGTVLSYEYDFGSTTELVIKSRDVYEGTLNRGETIRLLARNEQPVILCDECGKKPAVEICTECQWDNKGWLCKACSKTHDCGEEMLLPVVNSPRTGVCGYTGE